MMSWWLKTMAEIVIIFQPLNYMRLTNFGTWLFLEVENNHTCSYICYAATGYTPAKMSFSTRRDAICRRLSLVSDT